MSQPLGVIGGPVPTGGPAKNTANQPLGVLTPAPGVPAAAAPSAVPGVIPAVVSVQPHHQTIAPNAPSRGVGPTGPIENNVVVPTFNPPPPLAVMMQAPAVVHQPVALPHVGLGGSTVVQVLGPTMPARHGSSQSPAEQGYVAPHLQPAWGDRKKLWKDVGQIVVSSVLSIHNRSKLFKRALNGYLWQTMPAESWEIVLVDDCSTEDLSETYRNLLGRINLRHVKFDHTRHPLFRAKNPGWVPGQPKNWYHTPALTINLGFHLARGPIISLCHPEILHAPENFELAAIRILNEQAVYLFGTTYLGTQDTNRWLDKNPSWVNFGWKGFVSRVAGHALEKYGQEASYWYTSFLPRVAGRTIGGVDFEFLNGVAGEDDDFRDRMSRAGFAPLWAPELEGLHQDHSDEGEAHRVRTTDTWQRGLAHNRALLQGRRASRVYPQPANAACDWTARECFVEELRWSVGSKEPERIAKID
jgi:hypothetical protein